MWTKMHESARKGALALTAVAGLALGAGGTARAFPGPLNLSPTPPDIGIYFATLTYAAGTDVLSYAGFSNTYTAVGGSVGLPPGGPNGAFSLTATVSDAAFSGGSFSIANASGGPNLIEGTLTDFGYKTETSIFEFTFNTTGGSLAGDFGSEGGMILTATGFPGNFAGSFAPKASQTADVFAKGSAVPEPATSLLMLVGLAGAHAARRARRAGGLAAGSA